MKQKLTTTSFMELVEEELKNYNGFYNSVSECITVWYCKTVQNHKGIFIVKDNDGYIYNFFIEATYNGDVNELYLDFYLKQNKVIVRA